MSSTNSGSESALAAKYEAENQEILREYGAVWCEVVRVDGKICQLALQYQGVEIDAPFLNFPSLPLPGPIDVSTSTRSTEIPAVEAPDSETPKS
jgi:hypothetical protein